MVFAYLGNVVPLIITAYGIKYAHRLEPSSEYKYTMNHVIFIYVLILVLFFFYRQLSFIPDTISLLMLAKSLSALVNTIPIDRTRYIAQKAVCNMIRKMKLYLYLMLI